MNSERVDFHAHRPTSRGVWGLREYVASDYLQTMDRAGVGQSVILPLDGLVYGHGKTNDEVAAWCAQSPERLIPFATVDARKPDAAAEARRCVQELGVRGFKFHPWMQGFYPLDREWLALFEVVAELGVPALFHDGTPPDSTPLQIAQVAKEIPGLQVILGHGGLHDLWLEAIAAVDVADTVHLCMTSLPALAMQEIVRAVPAERLLFGADGGCGAEAWQPYVVDRWRAFDDLDLTEEYRTAITRDNPALLLGGERP